MNAPIQPEPIDGVIQPPRGYGIGFFDGRTSAIVGCFATEAEARDLLSRATIVVLGAPTGWHEWCGAENGPLFCQLQRGHESDWHDNGSVAWPVGYVHESEES